MWWRANGHPGRVLPRAARNCFEMKRLAERVSAAGRCGGGAMRSAARPAMQDPRRPVGFLFSPPASARRIRQGRRRRVR